MKIVNLVVVVDSISQYYRIDWPVSLLPDKPFFEFAGSISDVRGSMRCKMVDVHRSLTDASTLIVQHRWWTQTWIRNQRVWRNLLLVYCVYKSKMPCSWAFLPIQIIIRTEIKKTFYLELAACRGWTRFLWSLRLYSPNYGEHFLSKTFQIYQSGSAQLQQDKRSIIIVHGSNSFIHKNLFNFIFTKYAYEHMSSSSK